MVGSCLPRIDAEFFVLHLSQVPTVSTDQITCRRMGLVVSPLNVMFRAEVTNITWLAVLAKIQSGLGLNRVNELYGNDDMKTLARSRKSDPRMKTDFLLSRQGSKHSSAHTNTTYGVGQGVISIQSCFHQNVRV